MSTMPGPQSRGPLTLTYYGHCAFHWRTEAGLGVLADPYRNIAGRYWFTRLFPEVTCDLGLITHAHFDHDAAERLPEGASLMRLPGEFASRDLSVRGVLDLHSGASRLREFPNVMYKLQTGGISFLHLGDNRADWPDDVARAIGEIDVLLVTVDDSNHLLSYQEVDSLVARLEPRVVIPMHYQIPGLMADDTGLEPPEGWLATQTRVKRLDGPSAVFSAEGLPSATEVWLFQPSPVSFASPAVGP
ncbi:MAG: MBL fold metallo-hydrolase [Chloroflexi bacterium]|nr:MBL fold metallo-hydrolase [Chloroflexota bacterium]MDA1270799.1 MBL fold metallo-hydrolase [Chloroflexota bacterium]